MDPQAVDVTELVFAVEQVLYHRPRHACLLVVHTDVRRLTQVAIQLCQVTQWPHVAIDDLLCERLLVTPLRERGPLGERMVTDTIKALAPGPVLCSALDLLFEPQLDVNPLALLRQASLYTPLVALWPGSYSDNVLSYAVPEHAHYRTWRHPDLCDGCIYPV